MLLHIKIKEIKELNNCKSNNLNLEIKQIQYKVLNEMKYTYCCLYIECLFTII